jgi:antitoxin VapB
MLNERSVSLFRNGRNQAVRIPREFELQGTQALMRRDGESLVITPIKKSGLLAVLAQMQPMDEDFPAIEDLPLPPVIAL